MVVLIKLPLAVLNRNSVELLSNYLTEGTFGIAIDMRTMKTCSSLSKDCSKRTKARLIVHENRELRRVRFAGGVVGPAAAFSTLSGRGGRLGT